MKKKMQYLIVGVCLCTSYVLHAQVSNPSTWESFVNSEDNPVISDTFRLQTFGKSKQDNWAFTLTDSSSVVQDKYTLKIPVGSSAIFQPYSLDKYSEVKVKIRAAGLHLSSKDTLFFYIFREGENTKLKAFSPTDEDYLSYQYFTINTPSSFTIKTTRASENSEGYYMTDTLFAYGNIPSYSLFTGSGDWNDSTRWSHLPPLRKRSALINGAVSTTEDIQCNDISIYAGSLQIGSENQVSIQNLDLYGDESALLSNGTIQVSNSVTLHKTFEKVGAWYFISFPFDVYPSGIDSRFKQKDDTPNEGGNYFYVQTYNGEKRASENQASGNWEVLAIQSDDTTPLFEKNKGYLIALDEKATDNTLSFASKSGDIPTNFAQSGTLSIQIEGNNTVENQENQGWYLCGNPLPAPLALSKIKANGALDGYVYVYDGNTYQAYSLNSNYALPAFSAFFVKASSTTEIEVTSGTDTKAVSLIPTQHPLSSVVKEPLVNQQTTRLDNSIQEIHYTIKREQLYVENIPASGHIRIFNLVGQCVLQRKIQAGSQMIPLPLGAGVYILQIQTPGKQIHTKFTR